jgi:hypothetical protein
MIHYLALGVISGTARSMTEIVFSFEILAGLFDCLSIGRKPPEFAALLRSADVITGVPEWLSPLEITSSATEERQGLVVATSRFYQSLGLYLEHCALIMRIVGIQEPVRESEVQNWRGPGPFGTVIEECGPAMGLQCHSLPPLDFFRAKLLFVQQFQLDGNKFIPPPADFPAPVQTRSVPRTESPGAQVDPVVSGPPLTRETIEIAFRRRVKARSLAESLTGAFDDLKEATTDQVLTAETSMTGLASHFRDLLEQSHDSVSDLWSSYVKRAVKTDRDLPRDEESPIRFDVEIETSLFPVPVIRAAGCQ